MKKSIENKIEEINSMLDSINEESTTKEYINSINNMAQGNFFNNLENAKKEIEKCLLDKGFEVVGDRINGRDYVEYDRERKSEEELDRVKAKKVEGKYKI